MATHRYPDFVPAYRSMATHELEANMSNHAEHKGHHHRRRSDDMLDTVTKIVVLVATVLVGVFGSIGISALVQMSAVKKTANDVESDFRHMREQGTCLAAHHVAIDGTLEGNVEGFMYNQVSAHVNATRFRQRCAAMNEKFRTDGDCYDATIDAMSLGMSDADLAALTEAQRADFDFALTFEKGLYESNGARHALSPTKCVLQYYHLCVADTPLGLDICMSEIWPT